ncbi:hypothetical protein MJO29_005766, partial [Puccinia striiformis f. sp. tritici]
PAPLPPRSPILTIPHIIKNQQGMPPQCQPQALQFQQNQTIPTQSQQLSGTSNTTASQLIATQKPTGDPTIKHFIRDAKAAFEET